MSFSECESRFHQETRRTLLNRTGFTGEQSHKEQWNRTDRIQPRSGGTGRPGTAVLGKAGHHPFPPTLFSPEGCSSEIST